ncbi:Outer membrane protein OmpA [Nannocystis exedens]|uniref:Outer membrane protein OmpA n=1 Tax=Nannocystis exedens TaxID=54 RepID=A0A1I2GZH3_9BACT|nr:OmpA family protein [Nannocystis exedens]PCC67061.1 V-type H+-translocating pyrophosphatase [Nannocystis exedens]SFF23185.1 Outer membrane protein OmpA [Nannocystis exedens]
MTISLTDTVRDALTSGGIVNGAASALGISSAAATKGLGAAGSAMLAGLTNKARDPLLLGEFFNMAQDPALASPALDDPARLLSGAAEATRARDLGSRLMSSLFGGRTDDVISGLARHAGLGTPAAASLMSLAAPLVLRAVGGLVRGGGMTVGSLGQALLGNQSEIMNAVPPAMAGVIGRAQIYDVVREPEPQVPHLPHPAVIEPKRPPWWAIPLALLPLALLAWWFVGGRRTDQQVDTAATRYETPAAVATRTPPPTPPPPPASKPATPPPPARAEPELKSVHVAEVNRELRFAENGVEARLLAFLRTKDARYDDQNWFEFDRLVFDTDAPTLAPGSNEQLENLAAILKAYPGVHIKIGGYTDNTGDPNANLKLSQERADTVKKELVARGVSGDRIETEGYGEQHPIASNSTEEGRAQNRRIALRVLPPKS